MRILDVFSNRTRIARGELPDIYKYDVIPVQLRIQIVHLWREGYGQTALLSEGVGFGSDPFYDIERSLSKEYGLFRLGNKDYSSERVVDFFLDCKEIERTLDCIELSFRYLIPYCIQHRQAFVNQALEIIEELNDRFRWHGVGYEFVYSESEYGNDGRLVRIDSQIVHTEAIRPALQLLRDSRYKGANEEYLKAHKEYRRGDYKDCITDCNKAFESMMKAICDKRGWAYSPSDTARPLIDICLRNGLVPSYMQSHLTGLRTTLESGITTLRNRQAGHGQGANVQDVDRYVAQYALNLTATNVLFLVEAEQAL